MSYINSRTINHEVIYSYTVLYGFNQLLTNPGGEVIKYGLGKDATEIFKRVGHKDDALEYVNKYYIGVLHS